ncbi:MAG: DUF4340 domain-containing protein [Clostridiaceae bacterium]|jgi:hypothetical protein|nr:DUF4340 domain-containing protein [Clostridiaceae bacterium]
MRRLMQFTTGLAILAVVLAVTLLLLLRSTQKTEELTLTLSDRKVTDVRAVHLTNASGTWKVGMAEGGYVIEDLPSEYVDIEHFIDFLGACADIRHLPLVVKKPDNLAVYGLDTPEATLNVEYMDGATISLSLGMQEPISGDRYCTAEGHDGIYLIESEQADFFLLAKNDLLSLWVTPKLALSSALSALQDVTFVFKERPSPIVILSVQAGNDALKSAAISFGAPTHLVVSAGLYELDATYGLEVLAPLCGMRGATITEQHLTSELEREYGFDDPWLNVSFGYRNSADEVMRYILRFQPVGDDGSLFYVNAEGSPLVYTIKRQPFMDIEFEKLLLRWFLSPLLMDVSAIEIEMPEGHRTFALDQENPREPSVTMDGEPLDIDRFRLLFRLLGSAASDGRLLPAKEQPDEVPLMRITYRYPGEKHDDVMALYHEEDRRVRVYINGISEFSMKESFVTRVSEALEALDKDEDFDITW